MPLNKKGKPTGNSAALKASQGYSPAFGRAIVKQWYLAAQGTMEAIDEVSLSPHTFFKQIQVEEKCPANDANAYANSVSQLGSLHWDALGNDALGNDAKHVLHANDANAYANSVLQLGSWQCRSLDSYYQD